MKTCPSCGNEEKDNSSEFCSNCGNSFEKNSISGTNPNTEQFFAKSDKIIKLLGILLIASVFLNVVLAIALGFTTEFILSLIPTAIFFLAFIHQKFTFDFDKNKHKDKKNDEIANLGIQAFNHW